MPKSLKEMLIEAALAGDAEWEQHERDFHHGEESWMDCTYTGPGISTAFIADDGVETIYATPDAILAVVDDWIQGING